MTKKCPTCSIKGSAFRLYFSRRNKSNYVFVRVDKTGLVVLVDASAVCKFCYSQEEFKRSKD